MVKKAVYIQNVIRFLDELRDSRSLPSSIVCDNGAEDISTAMFVRARSQAQPSTENLVINAGITTGQFTSSGVCCRSNLKWATHSESSVSSGNMSKSLIKTLNNFWGNFFFRNQKNKSWSYPRKKYL